MKWMVSYLLVIFGLCSFMTPEERRDWLEYQKSRVEAVGEDPVIEQLAMLMRLVGSTSESEEAAIVRELAWQKLLTIPDFPERIRDHVLETRATWKRDPKAPVDHGAARGMLYSLGGVPYPGVVKVLGDFLYDDEWPGIDTLDEEFEAVMVGNLPNSWIAAQALGRLVENPPIQGDPENYQRHDIPTWRLWYEQVKAGTRTFRFKGDPQEYTLAGPVSEARTPQANRTSKDPATPDSATPEATETSRPRMAPVALALALALCAVALWRVLRGRRA